MVGECKANIECVVTQIVEGEKRIDLVVRMAETARGDIDVVLMAFGVLGVLPGPVLDLAAVAGEFIR